MKNDHIAARPDDDVHAFLAELPDLACHGVPDCAAASVSLRRRGGRVTTLAMSSREAGNIDEAQYDSGDGPCLTAIAQDVEVEVEDYRDDPRWPAVSAVALAGGMRSSLSVPLRMDHRLLGALNLYAHHPGAFDAQARRIADVLARQASAATSYVDLLKAERAARARDRHIAETLQQGMRSQAPELPGMTCAGRYLASADGARVGGDWYDVFALPDGAVGVAVGDVMGHDVQAASAMAQLRSVVRAYGYDGSSPSVVLDRLDRLVQGFGMTQLATAVYGRLVLDRDGALLVFGNAGHPPPMVLLPDGTVQQLHGGASRVIGAPLSGMPPRSEAAAVLPSRATLVLYTDGLIERKSSDVTTGLELLAETLSKHRAADSPQALCDRLVDDLLPDGYDDDVALLAIRID